MDKGMLFMWAVLVIVPMAVAFICLIKFRGGGTKEIKSEDGKPSEESKSQPVEKKRMSVADFDYWFAEVRQRDATIMSLQMELSRKDLIDIRWLEGRLMEKDYEIERLEKESRELKNLLKIKEEKK